MKLQYLSGILCASSLFGGALSAFAGSPVTEAVEAKETVIVEDDGFSLNKAFDTL